MHAHLLRNPVGGEDSQLTFNSVREFSIFVGGEDSYLSLCVHLEQHSQL